MSRADVQLLDLVPDHHHKPRHHTTDNRDHRVPDPLGRPRHERLGRADSDQRIGYVPQVTVAPSVTPDIRYDLCVGGSRGAEGDRLVVAVQGHEARLGRVLEAVPDLVDSTAWRPFPRTGGARPPGIDQGRVSQILDQVHDYKDRALQMHVRWLEQVLAELTGAVQQA
ncbi:hypothetical protein ACFY1L_47945 [Streptomyces sp. NPDC001663]|uniref:hypothetical protein n=1 Tax=Streptomyces sp. NPDC001663 TaxID=3364597 RepID=UPI0036C5862A